MRRSEWAEGGVSLQTHSDKYLRFQIFTASHQSFSFWKDIETPGCYFHPLSDMFQLNCFHWYYDSDMICVATDTVTPGPNDTDFSLSWAHVVRCDNQSGNIYRQTIKRKKSLSRFHLKCIYLKIVGIKFAPSGMLKILAEWQYFCNPASSCWDWGVRMLGGKMTDTWCQLSFEGIQPSVNIKVGHIIIMMTFAPHHGPHADR